MAEAKPKKRKRKVVSSRKKSSASLRRVIKPKKKKASSLELRKFISNPIITPSPNSYWESTATFNPSAVYGDGKIHIIYRATGVGDISMFGYASSKDGFTIDSRGDRPAYFHRQKRDETLPYIPYLSGGGWSGGCEDPHLTKMNDTVYMLYTSFDGWGSIRIALTSIAFEDFAKQSWKWKNPVLISPYGEIHKNWILFPEKIKGKYAILHSIVPKILIEYIDDLDEFDGKTKFIKSVQGNRVPPKDCKGLWLRGAGPAPIKTKYGWLVLNHIMDVRDPNRYKIGAMLLDLKDPTKILAMSSEPILEPDEWYENNGHKSGVVYACGAVEVNGWLFAYYGGADIVTCVAVAEMKPFLKELLASKTPKLKNIRIKKK